MNGICIVPHLAPSGTKSMAGLMQKHSEVVHIEIYSMSSNADKSLMKRTFSLTESRPDNKWGEISMATPTFSGFLVVGINQSGSK